MRLIDADALDAEMYHKSFEVDDGRNVWNSGLWIRYKIFEEALRDAPTIDAVPVVRCKDCRYFGRRKDSGYYTCGRKQGCVDTIPEGFCGWAVRNGKDVE